MDQTAPKWIAAMKLLATSILQRYQNRFWLIIVGAVLSIPTSIWGYNSFMYKWAKQESNCVTGYYQNVARLADKPFRLEDTLNKTDSEFKDCLSSVDPTKSNYIFIRDEAKRIRSKQ